MVGVTGEGALQCRIRLRRRIQRIQEGGEVIRRQSNGLVRLHDRLRLFDRIAGSEWLPA